MTTMSIHPLYRISTAVEDGQELQLSWSNSTYYSEESYDCDGNIECIYNETDDIASTTIQCYHPPSSSSAKSGATISTCDSMDTTSSSSSSSQRDCGSLNLILVDDQSNSSGEEQQEDIIYEEHQQEQDEKLRALCPVTGQYSNLQDHYFIPSTSNSSSSSMLGIGQYGHVQSCIHISTGRPYAVKTLQKSKVKSKHIQRELHLLTRVTNHPNIVKLVDFHEDEDHVHIITEKCSGGELFDVIGEYSSSSGCLSEGYAASIIKCVLEAVVYLHSIGIVHRDVKPENILFEYERSDLEECYGHFDSVNSIRLIDFGLSREYDFEVDGYMSNPVGTSYYMAPEVLEGRYTQSCDVWSVGIITYTLLCGFPPFNGLNDQDIKQTIVDYGNAKNVNFQLRGWAGKSEEAKDFVKCLLRRDPRKRFTAEEALMHPWLKMYC